MIDLIITACLLTDPGRCQTMTTTADGSPMTCFMSAPQTIAQWQERHPKLRVVRMSCLPHEDAA